MGAGSARSPSRDRFRRPSRPGPQLPSTGDCGAGTGAAAVGAGGAAVPPAAAPPSTSSSTTAAKTGRHLPPTGQFRPGAAPWAQAEQYYQQALAVFSDFAHRTGQAKTYHQLGSVAQARAWSAGRAVLPQALTIFIDSADRYGRHLPPVGQGRPGAGAVGAGQGVPAQELGDLGGVGGHARRRHYAAYAGRRPSGRRAATSLSPCRRSTAPWQEPSNRLSNSSTPLPSQTVARANHNLSRGWGALLAPSPCAADGAAHWGPGIAQMMRQ